MLCVVRTPPTGIVVNFVGFSKESSRKVVADHQRGVINCGCWACPLATTSHTVSLSRVSVCMGTVVVYSESVTEYWLPR